MTEDGSFFNRLTKKQLYVFAAIGILILAAGAVCSYTSKDKLKSGALTADEEKMQSNIYAVSKIVSTIGFIIAIIPSVKILQNEVKKKEPKSKNAADENKKTAPNQSEKQNNEGE
ncbi:MAG: hypothetical protein FWE54_03320 [Methanimicrococcus sp.]|nr:hypothetical protein [Methanimicrococcus sp.]